MAVIGGFQSTLSITHKIDRNFRNLSAGVLFPKSGINENGGK